MKTLKQLLESEQWYNTTEEIIQKVREWLKQKRKEILNDKPYPAIIIITELLEELEGNKK